MVVTKEQHLAGALGFEADGEGRQTGERLIIGMAACVAELVPAGSRVLLTEGTRCSEAPALAALEREVDVAGGPEGTGIEEGLRLRFVAGAIDGEYDLVVTDRLADCADPAERVLLLSEAKRLSRGAVLVLWPNPLSPRLWQDAGRGPAVGVSNGEPLGLSIRAAGLRCVAARLVGESWSESTLESPSALTPAAPAELVDRWRQGRLAEVERTRAVALFLEPAEAASIAPDGWFDAEVFIDALSQTAGNSGADGALSLRLELAATRALASAQHHQLAQLERRALALEEEARRQSEHLFSVYGSVGYRTLSAFWNVRDAVAPRPTRRRRVYDHAMRAIKRPAPETVKLIAAKLVSRRQPAYSPYERLSYFKPIPVETFAGPVLERAKAAPSIGFSLITTVYNERSTVVPWLESLERQTLPPSEVVIVDGGSSDGTADAIEAYAKKSVLPIKLVRAAERINIAVGRNRAIRAASHDVLLVTDCGCTLSPDWVADLVAPFRADPAIDVAAGSYEASPESSAFWASYFVPSTSSIDPDKFLPSSRSVAFRREVWERAGGYPEWLTLTGEDTLFDLQIRRMSRKWAFVPSALVYWNAPATLEQALRLARRYGEGDGEAGLEGLWDYYRLQREGRSAKAALKIASAAASLAPQLGARNAGRLIRLAQAAGYAEGKSRRIERMGSAVRGNVFILSGVPLYDSGGGQRGAQLALAFITKGYKVTFVNVYPSFETARPVYLDTDFERLELCSMDDFDLDEWMRRHESVMDRTVALLEFPHPRFVGLTRRLRSRGARVVYDCIDNWKSSLGWTWYTEDTERKIVAGSNCLVASARMLQKRLGDISGRPVGYLPQGVNPAAFRRAQPPPRPADLPSGQPIILYVGALWGSWFDWDLVRATSQAFPDASLVFVGEYKGECPWPLPNAHFLGLKQHSELAGYLAAADVCTIPFKLDEVTRAVNPLKVFEYLAMGKPVVASALPELAGLPYVQCAESAAEYVESIRKALQISVRPVVIDEFLQTNSWSERVEALMRLVEKA